MQGKLERKIRKMKKNEKKERKRLDINDKRASEKQFTTFCQFFWLSINFRARELQEKRKRK